MIDKREQRLHTLPPLVGRRRALRMHGTAAEARLWSLLKRRQLFGRRFRRQHSVAAYVLDFYCSEERLAVELDGEVHVGPLRAEYDAFRQLYLERQGIRVLRFENRLIFEQPDLVLEGIASCFRFQ